MSSGQSKARLCVIAKREDRRCESFYSMACFTRAAIEAASKLSGMSIAMAIGAKLMGDFLFEIAAAMALLAAYIHMPTAQREIRQIMIEAIARHALPTLGAVTAHAILAEPAAMRILMARHAIAKTQFCKLRKRCDFFIANFCLHSLLAMTLCARDLLVAAG